MGLHSVPHYADRLEAYPTFDVPHSLTVRISVIVFLCQNGHRIQCPDDMAGRAAKCPKCGVLFRVPSGAGAPEASDPPAEAQAAGERRQVLTGEPQIEFLCPNGHRLHGPKRMQGETGQCPDCGTRFHIPTNDELSDEEPVENEGDDDIVLDDSDDGDVTLDDSADDGGLAIASGGQLYDRRLASAGGASAEGWPAHFSRLWQLVADGATLEVQLTDGTKLAPEHYLEGAAGAGHLLFWEETASGLFTVTSVAWQSISRVTVRGLPRLPGDMRRK